MKKINRRDFLKVSALSLAAAGLAACGGSGDASSAAGAASSAASAALPATITFAAARQGVGQLYPLAVAIGELYKDIGITNYSVTPGGTVANVSLVDTKQCDVGFSSIDCVAFAEAGKTPYESAHNNVSTIALMYAGYPYLATLEGTGITSIEDLRGKRVSVGSAGSVQYMYAEMLLAAYGMTFADLGEASNLSYGDAIEGMKDGTIDAQVMVNSIPNTMHSELNQSRQIVMVPLGEAAIKYIQEQIPGIQTVTLPAEKLYDGCNDPYETLSCNSNYICRADLHEDVVYELTKAYVEGIASLGDAVPAMKSCAGEMMAQGDPASYHPGAVKYYKEIGWMD